MPLYEIAIIQKPTKKEAEEGGIEKLLFGPKAVVARDEQAAAVGAVAGNGALPPETDLNRIDVLIRPFCG